MSKLLCPYCKTEVDKQSEICPNCNNNLIVQCPYCKQNIKAYEKVCPYCTTPLVKTDYLRYANLVGTILSIIWTTFCTLGLILFWKYPDILNYKDKDGDSEMVMTQYVSTCIRAGIFVSIPYIISLIQKYKPQLTVMLIVINIVLMTIFTSVALNLKFGH